MTKKPAASPSDLLKQFEAIEAKEAALAEQKRLLAQRLREAASQLDGDTGNAAETKPVSVRAARKPRRTKAAPRKTSSPKPRVTREEGESTWTATMLRIIEEHGGVMTYPELREEIAKTHLAPKLAQTDKSFYGSMGKLEEKKKTVRHNGRIFTVAAYEKFQKNVAAGIVKDEKFVPTGSHQSPVKVALLEYLAAHPDGAEMAHIMAALIKRDLVDVAKKHGKNSVYNLIARLIERGELEKNGYLIRAKSIKPSPDEFGDGSLFPKTTEVASVRH